MSHKGELILLAVALVISLGITGCNLPRQTSELNQNAAPTWNPCEALTGLALDIDGAASAPALVGPQDAPTLGTLGAQGAQALADQLQPQGTFCDAEVPAAFTSILEKAQDLADQGDQEGARKLLNSLLDMGVRASGHLLDVRLQTASQARSSIAGYLAAAGIDQAIGGDGRDFIDQANATFNQMANNELGSATFDETLRLAEEAQLLGQEDIAQRALQRAQDIAAEGLDAAIEDLDPCLSNPQDLHDEITKLLLAFQTASLLGVPNTHGPGDPRYDATWSRATEALKAIGGVTPDECKGLAFHFIRTVSGEVTMTGEGHSCNGLHGPWEGELHLSGTWTDFGNSGEGNGTFSFTVPEGSDEGETTIQTSGQINADEGCVMPYTDPLQMRIHILSDTEAEIGIVSTNAGTASIVCPEGTVTLPSIMTVWTEEPTFTVALERGGGCP
ncbi:MAG: hypothetical protein ACK2T2_15235 [Anaerolineales bacterium]